MKLVLIENHKLVLIENRNFWAIFIKNQFVILIEDLLKLWFSLEIATTHGSTS